MDDLLFNLIEPSKFLFCTFVSFAVTTAVLAFSSIVSAANFKTRSTRIFAIAASVSFIIAVSTIVQMFDSGSVAIHGRKWSASLVDNKLSITSKSEHLKSVDIDVDTQDQDHIYVTYGSKTYKIKKSDLDKGV